MKTFMIAARIEMVVRCHARKGDGALLGGLCSGAGLLDRGSTTWRMKKPDADRGHQRHHNDHAK
jgi:hypothetical protein